MQKDNALFVEYNFYLYNINIWCIPKKTLSLQQEQHNKINIMVKSYQRKRTREEVLAGFKLAIAKKREWLDSHNLKELNVAETEA